MEPGNESPVTLSAQGDFPTSSLLSQTNNNNNGNPLTVDGAQLLSQLCADSSPTHPHGSSSHPAEEEVADDPISLQKLVLDVKGDLQEDDDAPTKHSTCLTDPTLADEATYECALHKKLRKERFMQKDVTTGEWTCREGATCKAASSESKKERRNRNPNSSSQPGGHPFGSNNSVSHTSVHSNNNASSMQSFGAMQGVANNNNSSVSKSHLSSTTQQPSMFVCAVHKKVRSARNMAYYNGQWVCLPHLQCQLPGERHTLSAGTSGILGGGNPSMSFGGDDRSGSSFHANNSLSSSRPPPPYMGGGAAGGPPGMGMLPQPTNSSPQVVYFVQSPGSATSAPSATSQQIMLTSPQQQPLMQAGGQQLVYVMAPPPSQPTVAPSYFMSNNGAGVTTATMQPPQMQFAYSGMPQQAPPQQQHQHPGMYPSYDMLNNHVVWIQQQPQ